MIQWYPGLLFSVYPQRSPLLLAAGLAAVLAAPAASQEHPVRWTLKAPPAAVSGRDFTIRLHATIPPGWHLYSVTQPPGGPIATTVVPGNAEYRIHGEISARPPETAIDNNFQIVTETWLDSVTLAVPLVARRAGADSLVLNVGYQTCTDRYCLPPTTDVLAAVIQVSGSTESGGGSGVAAGAASRPPPLPSPATVPVPTPAARAANVPPVPGGTTSNLLMFIWVAMGMGALSLLTPCVFPMIPITVSYFTKSGERSARAPVRNAAIYAAGIIATFTVLGMAMALLFGAGGINRFAANPVVNLAIAALFIALALNLFGAFQVTLPPSLLTRVDHLARSRGEVAGIVFMGLAFTLTSFTCTAPFVGTLLVTAARGDWSWPLLGLLAYATVFSLPFFVLAAVPAAAARLPRSGAWLGSVKVAMGFLELAAAIKFISNADLVLHWGVFTRALVIAIWLAIAVGLAVYLIASALPARRAGAGRVAVVTACLAAAVILARGLAGHGLGELESYLPPDEGAIATGLSAVPGELPWMINDYQRALQQARAERRPVLIDFTGYTCTNCRWMEANMFPRPAVRQAMARFVRVRLYTDGQGEVYRTQQRLEQAKLGTVALPYYAIVDSLGNVRGQFLGMTRNTAEFAAFLNGEDPAPDRAPDGTR